MDGINYYKRGSLETNISNRREGQFFEEFTITFPEVKANYIKFKSTNIGVCPPWHPAAGSESWIFVDEIRFY